MDEYKLHTGISQTYHVTNKDDFEEQTGKDSNYQYTGKDGVKRGLGVCPACDNPVRILGLYEQLDKQKAHARHHNKSTTFAVYEADAYYHCPNAKPSNVVGTDMSSKERKPSEYEKRMYYIMREYFDKAIYILNQDLSIHVSNSLAQRFLKEFVHNKGYMNREASIYNLPWILLERSYSFNLIGLKVKRISPLHVFLSRMNTVKLTPYIFENEKGEKVNTELDIIKPAHEGQYVVLIGHFIQHSRRVVEERIEESIKFGISDSKKVPIHWIYQETYSINQHRFPNLCEKGKDLHRNLKQLEIAKKIMPDLK